ncbi:hypothetical protein F5144DRAFT_273587 [Chaetomium tenue]|uniref:Uncharacterized protein n=1 Tax=Chaetomium tenue TaxID=1854479 RepID=A0ACB7P4F8_9PEZI|nr:hypothetical protein F5144DRAFT_273587 [Chaetomium globosum]
MSLYLVGNDGSLICSDCRYGCSACGNKIDDLVILADDQAFCGSCFRCQNCDGKIKDLRYARAPQGMFCMGCYEGALARPGRFAAAFWRVQVASRRD